MCNVAAVTDEKKSERIPVVLTPSLLNRIEDWRFTRRIPSRSDAIRQLIELGLERSAEEDPAQSAKKTRSAKG